MSHSPVPLAHKTPIKSVAACLAMETLPRVSGYEFHIHFKAEKTARAISKFLQQNSVAGYSKKNDLFEYAMAIRSETGFRLQVLPSKQRTAAMDLFYLHNPNIRFLSSHECSSF